MKFQALQLQINFFRSDITVGSLSMAQINGSPCKYSLDRIDSSINIQKLNNDENKIFRAGEHFSSAHRLVTFKIIVNAKQKLRRRQQQEEKSESEKNNNEISPK